jgi:hypothetical protein
MRDADTALTTLYVMADDFCKANWREAPRPGHPPALVPVRTGKGPGRGWLGGRDYAATVGAAPAHLQEDRWSPNGWLSKIHSIG